VSRKTAPIEGHERADGDHRLEREAHGVHRRPLVRRHLVEALDLRGRVVVGEQRQEVRDLDAVLHLALVGVVVAADRERRALLGAGDALEGGELRRLVLGDLAAGPVPDDDLHRGGERREGQRHDERRAVVVVALALQPRAGVDGGHDEARDDVAREVHVDELVPEVVVEQGVPRPDVRDAAVDDVEALRVVHPAVDGDDVERPGRARDDDRDPVRSGPAAQPVPPVDVDRDEDRLDEERDPLERERDAEDLAERRHELRPQQPELERQDRAR
jgi:hypothetical protein